MINKPVIAYERTVSVTEKDALDRVKDGVVEAFPDEPLLFKGMDSTNGGRKIQVVPFFKQDQVLAEFPVDALKGADSESFQKRITAGEFAPK